MYANMAIQYSMHKSGYVLEITTSFMVVSFGGWDLGFVMAQKPPLSHPTFVFFLFMVFVTFTGTCTHSCDITVGSCFFLVYVLQVRSSPQSIAMCTMVRLS